LTRRRKDPAFYCGVEFLSVFKGVACFLARNGDSFKVFKRVTVCKKHATPLLVEGRFLNAIRNFLARFLNFFFFKKRDKKKNLKFFICFLFVFKRFSPNTLKDIIAFFVPNSCASTRSARSSMCKRGASGPDLTAARFSEGVQFRSVFARFSVDFRFQTCRVCFLKRRRAKTKAQLPFCFLGRSLDIFHYRSFPQVKKKSDLCSDQKISSSWLPASGRRLFHRFFHVFEG